MTYLCAGANIYRDSYFGDYDLLVDLHCIGNESSLATCHQQTSHDSCRSLNTAGVYCTGDLITGIQLHMDYHGTVHDRGASVHVLVITWACECHTHGG